MATLKTTPNDGDVRAYLDSIDNDQRKADCEAIYTLMVEVTGSPGKMWGSSIVGFGRYHYVYESGREGDWFLTGFSNRKQSLTLYIMSGFTRFEELMEKLGKYKTGKGCLYVKKLADVNIEVLKTLVEESVAYLAEKYNEA
ncbi:MAG: DUF1801 domain-containing protein [Phaeodactylibacter sp.]|nr:DUF1801 domain-containing protein [Phaeodactylibacter sp.]